MILCSLAASAIVLATPEGRILPNTVQFFDRAINVTNRVLDRTICADIKRVHPVDADATDTRRAAVERNRERNERALIGHCESRLKAEGLDITECGASTK